MVKNPPQKRDPDLIPESGRFSWRRKWQPAPGFLLIKFHGQRRLEGYSPWGHKESDRGNEVNMRVNPNSV